MNPDYTAQFSSLYDVLLARVAKAPESIACADLSFGLRYSYHQLQQRVDSLASLCHELGVARGERVLWLGQNSARVLEGLLACARLGAIFCPVNWRQSEAELEFVLEDIDPVLVLWQQEEIGDALQSLRERHAGAGQHWLQHDGEDSEYEQGLRAASAPAPGPTREEGDTAVLMLYTAAFAGQPNGALLSHRAIIAQSEVFSTIRELGTDTTYLNVGPLFHVATLLETMATFHVGGRNVFIRRADAAPVCEAIEQEQCNSAFLLPPLMEQIVAYSEDHEVKLKGLKSLPGSQRWNALVTLDDSLWGRFPYGFGQTETFGYASYCALATEGSGTMGKASPAVEICMLDDDGKELPAGEVGEIAVRGATVMNGYWRRPELNRARRCGDWHRSNDLGRIEADGSLSFIGPKARMIRSGQENIYPAEVENCLKRHPAVAEAAVIGVPDPKWDQNVKAIVVLEQDAECSAAALIDFCRQHIASYKKPKLVEWVDSLPKDGHAVDYRKLDEMFGGGGYPGSGK